MKKFFVRFANDESGSVALELCLFIAAIAIAILAVVRSLGKKFSSDKSQDKINRRSKAGERGMSLPSNSELHVASMTKIGAERKASRIHGAS
jgi:Flp pilus assembly pilin Flp